MKKTQQTLVKSQHTQPKVLFLPPRPALQAPLPRDAVLFRTLSLGEHSSDVTLLPFAQTYTSPDAWPGKVEGLGEAKLSRDGLSSLTLWLWPWFSLAGHSAPTVTCSLFPQAT